MPSACNLEVQVNEEHTFYLSKDTLLPRCGRLLKVYSKASSLGWHGGHAPAVRMVLRDLPGGPVAFESVARFCYIEERRCANSGVCGRIRPAPDACFSIDTGNVAILRCAAEYLEMTEEHGIGNLIRRTEAFLSSMDGWSFSDCVSVLKSCEALLPFAEKAGLIQLCVDTLATKASAYCCSSKTSSPGFFISPKSKTKRPGNSCKDAGVRWCDRMSSLSMYMMERVVKAMVAHSVDNRQVARVLLKYLESALPLLGYSSVCTGPLVSASEEKVLHEYAQRVQQEVLETVVGLLYGLEWATLSIKSLFRLRRVAIAMNAAKSCKKNLEEMIGSQLHKATLDDILIPRVISPGRNTCLYDVDLVLHLVRQFLLFEGMTKPGSNSVLRPSSGSVMSDIGAPGLSFSGLYTYAHSSVDMTPSFPMPLKLVGNLMDMYLAEIAPDFYLKAAKFKELAEALPDDSRDSHDSLYRALDIYLQAHPKTSGDEAMELYRIVDFEKLSFEACKHIMENPRISPRFSFQVLASQQAKLRAVLDSTMQSSKRGSCSDASCISFATDYASLVKQNEELRFDLQNMQEKVVQLEKLCKQLRSQMVKNVQLIC